MFHQRSRTSRKSTYYICNLFIYIFTYSVIYNKYISQGIKLYNYEIWLSSFFKFVSTHNAGTQNSIGRQADRKGSLQTVWGPMWSEWHSCPFSLPLTLETRKMVSCIIQDHLSQSWLHTVSQESEKLKEYPGGKESHWRPSCCFTPTAWVSRSLTTWVCHQMVAVSILPPNSRIYSIYCCITILPWT